MSDKDQFDWIVQGDDDMDNTGACSGWAMRLSDAADGLLAEAEQGAVDGHVLTCTGCAHELADAQRGAAWLALLKQHAPEPPANLLHAILEKTSGAEASSVEASAANYPIVAGAIAAQPWWGSVSPASASAPAAGVWGRLARWLGAEGGFAPVLQPRLAMTSAMAFLSICLTLNLLGVSVRNLSAESFRPGELQRTVADTGASLVRSFEGIRVVYRVESRVNEWRTASTTQESLPLGSR